METSEATNLCVMMGTLLKIQEHMENIDSDTVAPRQNQRKTKVSKGCLECFLRLTRYD